MGIMVNETCPVHDDAACISTVRASPDGAHTLLNGELLMAEFTKLFSPSDTDVFHCDYLTVGHYLDQHGIECRSCTLHERRRLVCFHIAMGMCAFGNGRACKLLAINHDQPRLMDGFRVHIQTFCEARLFTVNEVRFICNAVGLRLPAAHSLDQSALLLASAYSAFQSRRIATFDLLDFLSTFHNTSRHGLLVWCSGHGLYCKGSDMVMAIKQALIEHIIRGHCRRDTVDYLIMHMVGLAAKLCSFAVMQD